MLAFPGRSNSHLRTTIHHWRCRCRLAGRAASGSRAKQLERVMREELARSFHAELDQALGDDPRVYLIKQVKLHNILRLPPGAGDEQIAHGWGTRLVREVMRQIARGNYGLLVFPSQADYIAQFLSDLLEGSPWDRWFYRSFAGCRAGSLGESIRCVLVTHAEHLAAILAALQRAGRLERLLAALKPATAAELWSRQTPRDNAGLTLRPFYAAALALIDRLNLWLRSHPGIERLPNELGLALPVLDWRDSRSLAVALLSILTALKAHGYLRQSEANESIFAERLDQALQTLDWLDTDWLNQPLFDLLQGPDASSAPAYDLPTRPSGGLTTRQTALLAALNKALDACSLDARDPSCPSNALRLYASLGELYPEWQDDPLAAFLIERLLDAWATLNLAPLPAKAIASLFAGDLQQALNGLSMAQRAGPPGGALKFLFGLGEPGLKVFQRLAGPALGGDLRIHSPAAGTALLLRAALDARLAAVSNQIGLTEPAPLLLALLLRLAGPQAAAAGEIDPGLRLVCGLGEEELRLRTLDDLSHFWQGLDLDPFNHAWLNTLVGQRLLDGARINLFRLTLEGSGEALVIGDAYGRVWPLSQVNLPASGIPALLDEWLTALKEVCGESAAIVTADPELAAQSEGRASLVEDEKVQEDQPGFHFACPAALLQTLSSGRLNLAEADLQFGLAAAGLLTLWSRWLGKFSDSSPDYLLGQFIHRPGVIVVGEGELVVELEPRPLDIVLEMSGYLAPLEHLSWLGKRRLRFTCKR
jgi:hypothetical protein